MCTHTPSIKGGTFFCNFKFMIPVINLSFKCFTIILLFEPRQAKRGHNVLANSQLYSNQSVILRV